jgi:hypothetical protein
MAFPGELSWNRLLPWLRAMEKLRTFIDVGPMRTNLSGEICMSTDDLWPEPDICKKAL